MMRTKPLFLTVDIGPALATLPVDPHNADWEPSFLALPLLRDALTRLEQQLGQPVPVTWFVRADDAVRIQTGDPLTIVQRLLSMGNIVTGHDELAWMPMPAGLGDHAHAVGKNEDILPNIHQRLMATLGKLYSSRAGNLSHSNPLMHIFSQLGIRLDCSAVPGRVKHDSGWCVDWRITKPACAYHPSLLDYRCAGSPELPLLEVPLSCMPIKAEYDEYPLLRCINPAYHQHYLWPGLQKLLDIEDCLVMVIHPDEIFPEMRQRHPMVSYMPETFIKNMQNIIEELRRNEQGWVFSRICDYQQHIE